MNRHWFSVLVAFALPASLLAQTAALPASPKPASTPSDAHEFHDLPYVTNGTDRQRLDLYLPANPTGAHPVIAWIHGGGWQEGSKDKCPAKGFTAQGYVVASIGYRLSQQAIYPAQIEDCKAAIRWLRAHASEYSIDPERIGVWGASAGGHLVALLGVTGDTRDFDVGENLNQSSRVQCVVDWFGPADFLHYGDPPTPAINQPSSAIYKLLGGAVSEHPDEAKRASPVDFVDAHAAPFLIMQGDQDKLVPLQQSQLLQAALEKAGVESKLEIVPGAGHGGPEFNTPERRKLLVEFFARHLHPEVTKTN
ncbi:MAG TPA: alpha/beta hydrolase [Chthoniobacteraceae bacterium]